MKLKLIALIALAILFSCKSDEPPIIDPQEEDWSDCCSSDSTPKGPIFLASAFSPDGIGPEANEVLSILPQLKYPQGPDDPDSATDVNAIYNFQVWDMKGKPLARIDTLFTNDVDTSWDFKDADGHIVFGKLRVSFDVLAYTDMVFHTNTTVCSIDVANLPDSAGSTIKQWCRFTDQIEMFRGFVLPTDEPL